MGGAQTRQLVASLARQSDLLAALRVEIDALRVAVQADAMREPAPAVTAPPAQASELPEMLTSGQVRKALSVTINTVYALVSSGDLPAFKIGRDYRFRPADVQALLEKGRVRPGATAG